MDFVEKDNAFEVHADLPGMEEKDIEVKVANGVMTIKGQKEENKEEKKEDFHLGSAASARSSSSGVCAEPLFAGFVGRKESLECLTLTPVRSSFSARAADMN